MAETGSGDSTNPFLPKPPAQSPGIGVVQNAPLAVASAVFGGLSIPSICVCFLSAPLSIAAVVCGHMALGRIRRSSGLLKGTGLAITGLILGYGMLFVSLVGIGVMLWKLSVPTLFPSPEKIALEEAVLKISSDGNGIGHGNSAEARKLAEKLSDLMEKADKVAFTQTKAKLDAAAGHYVTWCELSEGRCAFIVHVPEYRRFSDDAKTILEKLACSAAEQVAKEKLKVGDELAVALRGEVLYGAIMFGTINDNGRPDEWLNRIKTDRLLPFFKRPPAEK